MKLLNVEKQDNIEFYLSCKFQPSTFNVRCKTDVTDGMPDKQTNERTTVCRGSAPRHNKNDNNVGLLRTVKKVWIQEEHSKQ